MILDGTAAPAMAAGNPGLFLNLWLVDGHGSAAHGAFATLPSGQGRDIAHAIYPAMAALTSPAIAAHRTLCLNRAA